MKLRPEQFAALRKQAFGNELIRSLQGDPQVPARDPQTGDVLVKDATGNTTRLTFDDQGFVGGVVSPLGRTWRLENDPQGRLVGLTNPAGLHLEMQYNSQGKVAVVSRDFRNLFFCL